MMQVAASASGLHLFVHAHDTELESKHGMGMDGMRIHTDVRARYMVARRLSHGLASNFQGATIPESFDYRLMQ